ncbi:MAG: Na/Pi cotransporter family protein, partial [Pseudomonadota bacterium]|nr:Na/Pi cotransporter family protein [Pseudomonadota bacterium]
MSMIDPQASQTQAAQNNVVGSTHNGRKWLLLVLLVYVMLLAVSMIGSGFKFATGDHAKTLF